MERLLRLLVRWTEGEFEPTITEGHKIVTKNHRDWYGYVDI